jgi:hypothetical protein
VTPEIAPGVGRRLTITIYRLACLDAGGRLFAVVEVILCSSLSLSGPSYITRVFQRSSYLPP